VSKNKNNYRKRGIRASRARLSRALTRAGLRTQAALAERIADIEGLDAAPKDVVNRVFREMPVEPTTLERVARALDVEAHTLYMTSDDELSAEDLPADEGEVATGRNARMPVAALVVLGTVLLTTAGWWFGVDRGNGDTSSEDRAVLPLLDLGTPTLVVMPIEGDTGGVLADTLRQKLGEHFTVATRTAAVLTRSLEPRDAAERLRSDAVVHGEIVTVGRLSGLRFQLFARDARHSIWAESLPTVALADHRDGIADRVTLAVQRAAGLPVPDRANAHFPLTPVLDDYLQGEYYLDRPSNELNIKRAQSRFEAALRQDANYARAHAGLCQTLLEEHWMADEERALNDAARACGHALQLDPDDPVVAAAHAHFLRRTGRNDEAIALYERTIEAVPKDAAALAGLAASLLTAFRQSGEHEYLVRAMETARRAADVDPVVWKPLFALGTMEWFDGNVTGAIAASEAARARDENEFVLANLGSFYLCDGAFELALDAYQRAKEIAPQSYVGDEFLGMAYYFLGDFEQSALLRRRAIDAVAGGAPEIHEMWGNLGDSHRQTGDTAAAVDAYLRAAEIAERDYLRGNAPVADRAARAYYYTVLQQLDADKVSADIVSSINDELDEIAGQLSVASAHRRMAQTYLLRGETGKAKAALAKATASCSGYGRLPDLQPLLGK
jgi:tetratricopeptide (TPR) repeat protein